jgi:hypothetical protein
LHGSTGQTGVATLAGFLQAEIGDDLMDKGLGVDIPTQPGAALFTCRKVK